MNSKVVSINLYAIFMLFLVVFLRETEVTTACNLSSVAQFCRPPLEGVNDPVPKCCTILQQENEGQCLCQDFKTLKKFGKFKLNATTIRKMFISCNFKPFDYTKCPN
ncbi:hypothetical protein OROGR_018180 [Orobanche gracilis]